MMDGVELTSMGSTCNWQEVNNETWEEIPMLVSGKCGEYGYEYDKDIVVCDKYRNMVDYILLCMEIFMVNNVDVFCVEYALYEIELVD